MQALLDSLETADFEGAKLSLLPNWEVATPKEYKEAVSLQKSLFPKLQGLETLKCMLRILLQAKQSITNGPQNLDINKKFSKSIEKSAKSNALEPASATCIRGSLLGRNCTELQKA